MRNCVPPPQTAEHSPHALACQVPTGHGAVLQVSCVAGIGSVHTLAGKTTPAASRQVMVRSRSPPPHAALHGPYAEAAQAPTGHACALQVISVAGRG